jgi:hypothetical protein
MSPTMTEGGIAAWKKKEGDSYESGDVLLEIVRHAPAHSQLALISVTTGNRQGYNRR